MTTPGPKTTSPPKELFLGHRDILLLIFRLFPVHQSQASIGEVGMQEQDATFSESRKQLKNFAVVCKSFCGPALDCLWFHLPNITPILNIHPALQNLNGVNYFGKGAAGDMLRFGEYARRVRSVNLTNRTIPSLSLTAYAWLGKQLGEGKPLLPGLRSITVSGDTGVSADLAILSLLLSQLVTDLTFEGTFVSDAAFRAYTLSLLCSEAPMIQHLSLRDDAMAARPDIWSTILDDIPNRLPLKNIDIRFPKNTTLDPAFLARFCRKFSLLTSITLDVHSANHQKSEDLGIKGLLPALKSLHLITRCDAKLCACYPAFLLTMATCITFEMTNTLLAANAFDAAVQELVSATSLKEVRFLGNIYLSPGALAPFFRRLSLEAFHVDVTGFEMPNSRGSEICELLQVVFEPKEGERGKSFLSLSDPLFRLHLRPTTYNSRYVQPAPTYASLNCLVQISLLAPKLCDLVLSIDSACPSGDVNKTLRSLINQWSEPEVRSDLRRLTIADQRQSGNRFTPVECRDIARLLDLIFPRLECVVMHSKGSREWDESWAVIEEYRKMLQSLRLFRPHGMA